MIVSCGESLVDLVPDPVPGGGPFNVAVACARLGAPVRFAGCVSTDNYGSQIIDHLVANGVDMAAVTRTDAPTARAIIEHTPKLVFRFEGTDTADTMLDTVDLSDVDGPPPIVHGGTLGLFRGRTAETLAQLAERHTGIVSLDPNVRPQIIDDRAGWDHFHDRWLPHVSIYKGSDEDLEWIWPDLDPVAAAERLLAMGVTAVVLTRGSDGIVVYTSEDEISAAAPAVDVVDTVGAGDTIVGAILTSLHEAGVASDEQLAAIDSGFWKIAADRAVAAAGVTVTRAGAQPPHRHELDW